MIEPAVIVTVTCPVCGRPDRHLTSTGKLCWHNHPTLRSQDGRPAPCPGEGRRLADLQNRKGL